LERGRQQGESVETRDINTALDNIKAQIIKHYQNLYSAWDL